MRSTPARARLEESRPMLVAQDTVLAMILPSSAWSFSLVSAGAGWNTGAPSAPV